MPTMKELATRQQECCCNYNAQCVAPTGQQLVVISDGVLEGRAPLEGVRYPSPKHMTGWWLTTNDYDGNTSLLRTVHFYHIVERRPEASVYMALPYGYRFQLGGEEEFVWFDDIVANETE